VSGSAFDVLARIRANRAAPEPVGERCEMCSETIADEHQHVVNVEGRQLMCVCRGCYLLFTDTDAELRYRAVPDRYLAFPDFAFDRRRWEALQIPVGLAFFFHNSALDRTVGFYPGPAGATESLLDLESWDEIVRDNPVLKEMEADTQALLVNRVKGEREYYLVPIDECYRLVGLIRAYWHGLSGGAEVWDEIEKFFAELKEKSGVTGKARHA